MKYLYVLILLLLSTPCFTQLAQLAQLTPTEQLQENTVLLTNGHGHGSGVLFTRTDGDRVTTFVWTAAHVANIFMNYNGTFAPMGVIQGDKRATARVLRAGDSYAGTDCALLEIVSGDDFNGTAKFYRGFDEVKVGQKIVHCGTPLEFLNERLVTFGRVSYVNRLFDDSRLLLNPRLLDNIDITAYPGCSGGPVVDEGTYEIIGLLIMGSAPRLGIIEPTRSMYDWAKAHDCMWAFDREVELPRELVPWRADLYNRLLEERYTDELDDRWGHRPEPVVEIVEVSDEELWDMIADLLGVVLEQIPEIAPPMPPLDPPVTIPPGADVIDDTPPADPPPLDDEDVTVITEDVNITIEEDGTVIIRDIDGNLIEVIDPSLVEMESPFGASYEYLKSV